MRNKAELERCDHITESFESKMGSGVAGGFTLDWFHILDT